jgi:AraC-like DNA-binding protein
LKQTIDVKQLITLHYFEFGKEYAYKGERHDFWEFLYVDKGEIEVFADDRQYHLQSGTVVFHKPNEFHRFHANRVKAPNVVVITFDCHSRAMKHFSDRVIRLEDGERNLLAAILEEGTNAFGFPCRYPLRDHRIKDVPIGSEQLIKLYLETFLIRLLRKICVSSADDALSLSSSVKQNNDEALVKAIIGLLESRIDTAVSLEEISKALHISKTRLKTLFKNSTGLTIMEYFSKLKIDKAKVWIREKPNNFTEIAGMVGYGSVHHFSRAFKKATGMSPSEYAKSIKGRVKNETINQI